MATVSISARTAPTDHSLLARLVLATFMVLDAADFPYRLLTGDVPEDPWVSGLHRLAGLVACLSLLWGWRRTLVSSVLVTAAFVVARQEITGFELWWLPIALSLAIARRSWPLTALVTLLCVLFCAWTGITQGPGTVAAVVFLCVLGLAAGAALGFVSTQRSTARARVEALRLENARLRREERRLLAADLGRATEGLFARARRESAATLSSTDPDDLRRALHQVRDDARAALASLRHLLGVLRAGDADVQVGRDDPARRTATRIRSVRLAASISLAGLAVAGAVSAAPSGVPHEWVLVVALGGAALVCVRPVPGVVVVLAALAATLLVDTSAWVAAVGAGALAAAAALAPWRRSGRVGVVAALVCWTVARVWVGGADALYDVAAGAAAALGACLSALALHDYLHTLRSSRTDEEQLASERADIAPDERASLARELHDQLGHQLSLVALQVNAVEGVADGARLQEALVRIDATLAAASDELETLCGVLAVAPSGSSASGPLTTPSVVARLMADKLAEHGHETRLRVDPAADDLDPTTQLTLVRVLREATTNALRHAAPSAPVRGEVVVGDGAVSLRMSNAVPGSLHESPLSHLSGGHGLPGIRERVAASGGTFSAGTADSTWTVEVTLPVHADLVAAAAR